MMVSSDDEVAAGMSFRGPYLANSADARQLVRQDGGRVAHFTMRNRYNPPRRACQLASAYENFADAGLGPDLPAANACGLHRCAPRNPVAGVDAVDMLLDNVVAAQPDEVVSVVHLILHLGHARLLRIDQGQAAHRRLP